MENRKSENQSRSSNKPLVGIQKRVPEGSEPSKDRNVPPGMPGASMLKVPAQETKHLSSKHIIMKLEDTGVKRS